MLSLYMSVTGWNLSLKNCLWLFYSRRSWLELVLQHGGEMLGGVNNSDMMGVSRGERCALCWFMSVFSMSGSRGTGFIYPWLWLSYTFLFTFALVNILTALFVEKVFTSVLPPADVHFPPENGEVLTTSVRAEAVEGAKPEREYRILHERKKLVEQAEELRELFYKIDLATWEKILGNWGAQKFQKWKEQNPVFLSDTEEEKVVIPMMVLVLLTALSLRCLRKTRAPRSLLPFLPKRTQPRVRSWEQDIGGKKHAIDPKTFRSHLYIYYNRSLFQR